MACPMARAADKERKTVMDICSHIDHTLLKPFATKQDLVRVCAEAREMGFAEVALAAQVRARGFYEKVGYAACGEPFDEEGCPHILMTKRTGGR